jgi:hypothetical protein
MAGNQWESATMGCIGTLGALIDDLRTKPRTRAYTPITQEVADELRANPGSLSEFKQGRYRLAIAIARDQRLCLHYVKYDSGYETPEEFAWSDDD